jgi:hypothetical protein
MADGVSVLVSVGLGNDLSVLLKIMSMSVDSLKRRLAVGESPDREFMELEGAIDSAFQVSRELITVGEPGVIERSVIDVNELVAQLEGVLSRVLGPEIQVSLRLEALDAMVQAHAVQLEWVFLNLAANSREAMPDGGTLTIQTTAADRQVGAPPRSQRYVCVTGQRHRPGTLWRRAHASVRAVLQYQGGRRGTWPDQRRDDRPELPGLASHRKRPIRYADSHPPSDSLVPAPLTASYTAEPPKNYVDLWANCP